jgi:cyclase
MQSLKENVHIEDKYAGVTLAAINLPRGTIYIDAPLAPEDARSWRADLLELESGHERLLINLDTNIDRIIGARAMDTTVLAHEELSEYFKNRSGTFKTQGQNTGSEWENVPIIGNIRWAQPQITVTKEMTIHWGESPLVLEHHPGADKGAIWVILPEEKIVFVGDTVLKNQPPFFANADLPQWLEDLELLSSEAYQGYTIVSGRGGVCASSTIEKQQQIIANAYKKLEKLSAKNAAVEATEKLIPDLLTPLRFLASEKEFFTQRLRYGLREYYLRQIQSKDDEEE